MQSSIISKIEKARRYAQETDRVSFTDLTVSFRGENNTYLVTFHDGAWQCTCSFFSNWGLCSHTMAMERILDKMLPAEARTARVD